MIGGYSDSRLKLTSESQKESSESWLQESNNTHTDFKLSLRETRWATRWPALQASATSAKDNERIQRDRRIVSYFYKNVWAHQSLWWSAALGAALHREKESDKFRSSNLSKSSSLTKFSSQRRSIEPFESCSRLQWLKQSARSIH